VTADPLGARLADLRRAFDGSFARAPAADDPDLEHLLALRAGDRAYAVRLAQVRSLYPLRRIVPAPARDPAFLGLTGLRGSVVPVYGLAGLLGHEAGRAPAWILLAAGADVVALAFEGYDGHRTVPLGQLPAGGPGRGDLAVVRMGTDTRPLLDLAAVVGGIKTRVAASALLEEREK
jgi:chemotaxis signal transduction protein